MYRFVIDGKTFTGKTAESIARREYGRSVKVRKGNSVGTGTAYTIRNSAGDVLARGVFYPTV